MHIFQAGVGLGPQCLLKLKTKSFKSVLVKVAHTRKYSYNINSDIFLQDTSYGVADLVMIIECAKAVHKSALFAIEGWGWKE